MPKSKGLENNPKILKIFCNIKFVCYFCSMKNGILYNIAFAFQSVYLSVYRNTDGFQVSKEQEQWITQWYEMTKNAFEEAYKELKELYAQYPAFERCIKKPEENPTYFEDDDYASFMNMVHEKYEEQLAHWRYLNRVLYIGYGCGDMWKLMVSQEIKTEISQTSIFSRILSEIESRKEW